MSTQQKRLRASIQRIAREDAQLSKVLDAYANRGGFGAAVGSAQSDAEESRLCCDGSTSDNANPGTSERDPDSSTQSGLDPDDPAKLTAGEGSLTGLTDCATGEPVCMDGDGFIPPDGWDSPTEGPPVEEYEEGTYFKNSSFYSYDPYAVGDYVCANSTWGDGNEFGNCRTVKISDTRFDVRGEESLSNDILIATLERQSCSTTYNSVCDEDPPTATEWPSDGCTNLAIQSGTIVGSKYDPDQSGAYSVPMDSIELCDDSNGTSILYQPLPGGGFRTIESVDGVAVSGAVGYTYNAQGVETGTITQAEWVATSP